MMRSIKMIEQFIIISILSSMSNSVCPPEDTSIDPCFCLNVYKTIICDYKRYYNLTEIFERISKSYSAIDRDENKRLNDFEYINVNESVESLEENFISDLSFNTINISSEGIKKIHQDAFKSSKFTLKRLYLSRNLLLNISEPPYDLIDLVNSMANLTDFWISGNTSINEIPPKRMNNTSIRSVVNRYLHTLNDYAYYFLKNIEKIQICGNFDFIPAKAFVVESHNRNTSLNISIGDSLIRGSSFESGVFTNIKRTINLVFINNRNLEYLDQYIFEPLFRNFPNSTVNLTYNNIPLDCYDCHSKWIIERKNELKSNILGAKCKNGELITNLTIDDFNKYNNCNSQEKNKSVIICLCVGLSIIAVVLTILIFLKFKKTKIRKKRKNMMENLHERCQILERNSLDFQEILGEGQFGFVYKALFNNGNEITEVAVKTVKIGSNNNIVESCFKEATLLIGFEHERVLKPIGISFENNIYPMIIFPLMMNGDLLAHLRRRDIYLTGKRLLQFSHQIAEGMVYLSSNHFVHRDLAARNCLLDQNMSAKIGDFGLSRDVYAKHYYRSENKIALPYKWMAPECIEKGFYNSQTDVWSFGVLFWEILSRGSDPYPTVDNANILMHIKSGEKLPQYCSDPLYKLLCQCCSIEPHFRPNFPYISHFINIQINEFNQNITTSGEVSSGPVYV